MSQYFTRLAARTGLIAKPASQPATNTTALSLESHSEAIAAPQATGIPSPSTSQPTSDKLPTRRFQRIDSEPHSEKFDIPIKPDDTTEWQPGSREGAPRENQRIGSFTESPEYLTTDRQRHASPNVETQGENINTENYQDSKTTPPENRLERIVSSAFKQDKLRFDQLEQIITTVSTAEPAIDAARDSNIDHASSAETIPARTFSIGNVHDLNTEDTDLSQSDLNYMLNNEADFLDNTESRAMQPIAKHLAWSQIQSVERIREPASGISIKIGAISVEIHQPEPASKPMAPTTRSEKRVTASSDGANTVRLSRYYLRGI